MKLPCPSCKRDIESDDRVCPFCDWQIQGADHHPSPKRGGSFQGLLIMGIGGVLLWVFFMRPDVVAQAKSRALAALDPHLKRLGLVSAQAPAAAKPAEAPIERRVPDAQALPEVPPAESKPEPAPSAPEAMPLFRLGGSVFDLITLKPVARARVFVTDSGTQEKRETTTNDDGSFAISLAANMDGWEIQVRHDDYDRKYSEDWTPSLRTFSEPRRAEAAATIRSRAGKRVHILGREGEAVLKDLALIPRKFQ